MKNKTLEEAAENYRVVDCEADKTERYLEKAFIAGANYQKSISFSEEDMIGFAEWIVEECIESLGKKGIWDVPPNKTLTTKQLVQLYLKNKKK